MPLEILKIHIWRVLAAWKVAFSLLTEQFEITNSTFEVLISSRLEDNIFVLAHTLHTSNVCLKKLWDFWFWTYWIKRRELMRFLKMNHPGWWLKVLSTDFFLTHKAVPTHFCTYRSTSSVAFWKWMSVAHICLSSLLPCLPAPSSYQNPTLALP